MLTSCLLVASRSNRTRSRYETQYAKEGFDDAFLFDTAGISPISQDERTANFDIRLIPTDWLAFDAGVGRSEEREPQRRSEGTSPLQGTEPIDATEVSPTANATIRNNFNWGVNFNRLAGSSGVNTTSGRRSAPTRNQGRDTSAPEQRPSSGRQAY